MSIQQVEFSSKYKVGSPLLEIDNKVDEQKKEAQHFLDTKLAPVEKATFKMNPMVCANANEVIHHNFRMESTPSNSPTSHSASQKVLATPAVRDFSRRKRIDINQITGTGLNGRILKDDVLRGNYVPNTLNANRG